MLSYGCIIPRGTTKIYKDNQIGIVSFLKKNQLTYTKTENREMNHRKEQKTKQIRKQKDAKVLTYQ